MATKTNLAIPTGYEQFQRAAEEKRQLAKAMLGQGMQPLNNPTSWAQVLGQWAQNFAGNRMLRQADAMDDKTNQMILKDYGGRTAEAQNDSLTMDPVAWMAKHGNDPLLAQSPMMEGMRSAYAKVLGKKFEPNTGPKATDFTYQGTDGKIHINAPRVAAAALANGLPIVDEKGKPLYATDELPPFWPGAPQPQAQAQPPAQVPDPTQNPIYASAQAAGANPAVNPGIVGTSRPPDGHDSKTGLPVWKINGQYYDNPEGK